MKTSEKETPKDSSQVMIIPYLKAVNIDVIPLDVISAPKISIWEIDPS